MATEWEVKTKRQVSAGELTELEQGIHARTRMYTCTNACMQSQKHTQTHAHNPAVGYCELKLRAPHVFGTTGAI